MTPNLISRRSFLVTGSALLAAPFAKGQPAPTQLTAAQVVVLGHVVSEQGGMKYCTEWLKSFVTEVPIEFVPAREPFWNPSHPVES
jgi:hypothetical protein